MAKKTPLETIKSLVSELQEMNKNLPEVPSILYSFNNLMSCLFMAHDYLNAFSRSLESYNSSKNSVVSSESSKS